MLKALLHTLTVFENSLFALLSVLTQEPVWLDNRAELDGINRMLWITHSYKKALLGGTRNTASADIQFESYVGCFGLAPPGANSRAISQSNPWIELAEITRHLHLYMYIILQKRADFKSAHSFM